MFTDIVGWIVCMLSASADLALAFLCRPPYLFTILAIKLIRGLNLIAILMTFYTGTQAR